MPDWLFVGLLAYILGWHSAARLTRRKAEREASGFYWRNRPHAEIAEARRDAALWHGKYAIVKHENNQLRRKLYTTNRR